MLPLLMLILVTNLIRSLFVIWMTLKCVESNDPLSQLHTIHIVCYNESINYSKAHCLLETCG